MDPLEDNRLHREHAERNGVAPAGHQRSMYEKLQNLAAMLRLLVPDRDWRFVIRPGNRSLKRAIRGGPKPFVVRDVAEVMRHVRRLHRQGLEAAAGPQKWQAIRDAALLGRLATRAPRASSLTAMTMDRHLELRSDRTWHVWFPGEDTKNKRLLDYPFDAEVSRMLTDYLEQARARFPGAGGTDKLWMGMRGVMTRQGVRVISKRHTLA